MNTLYTKEINGRNVVKPRRNIILNQTTTVQISPESEETMEVDMQVFNPTHEMLIEDGWNLYELSEKTLSEEELFNIALEDKIQEIIRFDESSEVNECFLHYAGNIIPYWANKSERNDLKQAVQDYKNKGYENYRLDLRDVGISITFSCDVLLSMLSELEVYAINCFNVTTDHIFAVKTLTTIDDIKAYDYMIGYPEKLRFEI